MKAALLVLLLVLPAVQAAVCEEAYDQMRVTRDIVLCSKAYDVASGIKVITRGVTLDCNGAIIRGTGVQDGQGILIEKVDGVTVKNCNILNYHTGILLKEAHRNNIYHNAVLKSNIGIRLIQSFENRFEDNADKSLQKPVSAVASAFNTFWLTNKDIDQDFCAVNLCNKEGAMDPCVHDDFYCSPSCTYENDHDCIPSVQSLPPVTEYPALPGEPTLKQPTPALPEAITLPETTGTVTHSFLDRFPQMTRFWITALLFITAYLLGFLAFQHHHYHHK